MNIQRISKLVETLRKQPDDSFDMRFYFHDKEFEEPSCIAGHALVLFLRSKEQRRKYGYGYKTSDTVAVLLDIPVVDAYDLCAPSWFDTCAYEATPNQAANVIERYMCTKRVNWLLMREPISDKQREALDQLVLADSAATDEKPS